MERRKVRNRSGYETHVELDDRTLAGLVARGELEIVEGSDPGEATSRTRVTHNVIPGAEDVADTTLGGRTWDPDMEDRPTVETANSVPPVNATKDVWIDYAVSRGADRGEASGMTKQALIDEYGKS